MQKTLLLLSLALLIVGSVSAQDNMTDDGMLENGMDDDGDEAFDYEPIIALVVIAAVVFLVAKYGP